MSQGTSELASTIEEMTRHSTTIPPSVLLSATYDGAKGVAVLKFYEPESQTIRSWYDNTGHKPYCYSKLLSEQLEDLKKRDDILGLVKEKKHDLINDREIDVVKIIAKDPLAIGGGLEKKGVRDLIPAWEADIKYYDNYIYDRSLLPGTFYRVEDSRLLPIKHELPQGFPELLKAMGKGEDERFGRYLLHWAEVLSLPVPELRRASIDIEVETKESRIPDAEKAEEKVSAVAMVGSDGVRKIWLMEKGDEKVELDVDVKVFKDERELIRSVFLTLLDYPVVVSYNGDDFDLNYLYHRAKKFFEKEEIPISMGRDVANLKHGIHLDLYKTFLNKAIQVYAFGNRYSEHTLKGVAGGLLGESKLELEFPISSLPLQKLAEYCLQDAHLTYRLTAFDDGLLMKLLVIIARLAKMPVDDVARVGVSNWIRSMMYFEHRRMNAIIPRREELEAKGGASSVAIIKGKKYKGGMVVEPKPGVYFNIFVLDFASLYPSVIKVYNLSYETVRCIHEECRDNIVPETNHWVCRKVKGLSSLLIGSLRDLRVSYYKPLSKDPKLNLQERKLYEVVQQAIKVILNASYGVMGAEIFPLYCLPVAEATAAIGRYAISKTIENSKELGIDVIYGDTDSIFLRSPSQEQVHKITSWAESNLGIELDTDKVYRYVAMSQRKKNYLGVFGDGTVDIKGMTGKKSHTPPFIRQVFYNAVSTLSRVRSPEDFEKAREEIKKNVRESYLKLVRREISLEDLAFQVMLGKSLDNYEDTKPQHVKAAELLVREKKRELRAGDIVSFVKTTTSLGVKPVEMAKVGEIDNEKYLEYLRATFDQLLDSLGYEFDEILGETKLEDFFWGAGG